MLCLIRISFARRVECAEHIPVRVVRARIVLQSIDAEFLRICHDDPWDRRENDAEKPDRYTPSPQPAKLFQLMV
jgi:hypothetical protein